MRTKEIILLISIAALVALSGCFGVIQNIAVDNEPSIEPDDINITASVETAPTEVTHKPPADETPVISNDSPEQLQELVTAEAADDEFVRVIDYIKTVYIDLKYATTDNFTGTVVYDFTDAYLRYGTVKKLMIIQDELAEQGLGLKIWDGFRPVEAQFKLWEVCPDPAYVANPNTGHSSHSRGNTVDATLVYLNGTEVEMPTGFDDFSARADRDYSDVGTAAANATLLENIMTSNGFNAYSGEWWHFSDTTSYPVEENFSQ